jgi:putative transposase
MPRKLRADFEGAWHHVMNRGAGKASIFDEAATRIFLLELRDTCASHRMEVNGYCVLPNHYHLLLHTPEAGLSAAMQRLSSRFTQAVNRMRGRDGPLFRGRFRSVQIEDDAHLITVSQYIHFNPVEAGLATTPEAWPWSSAAAYVGEASGPEWLRISTLLAMIGGPNPRAAYARNLRERR